MHDSATARTAVQGATPFQDISILYCIRCGPDEERILDAVPREDGTCNSG